jgi:hypothetical protein
LPPESATAGITRFSFIAYGDTRGRHDGVEVQAEHLLVIESMLATIKKAASGPDAIKFVLQSGDAVQNGSIARQLSVSYIPLINRLTQDGGVPYFLSVGNHDVGSGANDPRRADGLRNYFAANSRLIPPEGSPRRLNGYPTYAFGYGNTFFVAFDSDIPDDTTQFAWVIIRRSRLVRTVAPSWSHRRPRSVASGCRCFARTTCGCCSPGTSICSSIGSSDTPTRAGRIVWTRS